MPSSLRQSLICTPFSGHVEQPQYLVGKETCLWDPSGDLTMAETLIARNAGMTFILGIIPRRWLPSRNF